MPIIFEADYFDFASTELEQILKYQKTGERLVDWDIDNKVIEIFEKKHRKVRDELHSNSPITETGIKRVEELLYDALETSKNINIKHVGEFQLGYTVNRFTIQLAKVKRWDKIKQWIELYFELPHFFRRRSNNTEKKALFKRLNKSLKQIAKLES